MFAATNFYVSDGPSKATRDKTTYIVYVSK